MFLDSAGGFPSRGVPARVKIISVLISAVKNLCELLCEDVGRLTLLHLFFI